MVCIRLFLFLIVGSFFLTACQGGDNDEGHEPSVPEKPILTIEPESIALAVGESYQLIAKLNGTPLEEGKICWESNTNLLNVDNNGKVTAIASDDFVSGFAVTATMQGGVCTACKITIYQVYNYKMRLTLKDKGTSDYSLNEPDKFLSIKAIERRNRRNIVIDELDLPISKEYLKQIEKVGGTIVSQSKWLKTVCVQCEDETLIDEYKKLPFVQAVTKVWRGARKKEKPSNLSSVNASICGASSSYSREDYGEAWSNIALHNGQILHERGFKGKGVDIAVIDAGFIHLPDNSMLNNIQIKGAKSFVYEDANPYGADDHGVWVTACMAGNKPGYYMGTAPEANYWLLRSEDMSGDYPVEEDNWVAAIEYADSVGVDVVNTSLYYVGSGWPFPSHTFEEMDGKTALPTRAANIAAGKGVFIVCCAGNHGSWVGTPADSPHVLATGSVTETGSIGAFTAFGMTVDGRMKPDVMSLGQGACTIGADGKIVFRNGTSYASPIVCGLAACLWQAYPWLSNQDLLDILKRSADRYNAPELPYGYGIIDIKKAIDLIDTMPHDVNL